MRGAVALLEWVANQRGDVTALDGGITDGMLAPLRLAAAHPGADKEFMKYLAVFLAGMLKQLPRQDCSSQVCDALFSSGCKDPVCQRCHALIRSEARLSLIKFVHAAMHQCVARERVQVSEGDGQHCHLAQPAVEPGT